ncbi:solute carrier organic anion transporter family member 4C1-like [Gigantopelta aegis]|uniref:solute carrier organic anion transporter family member 4C1-like n=1 Tax=Gigantopelta aegis TaxID=1735272 RepID=UPI001B88893E|nr:solute carrier organic anion transporter family member 4C1-like [Gigantopelta aegis]
MIMENDSDEGVQDSRDCGRALTCVLSPDDVVVVVVCKKSEDDVVADVTLCRFGRFRPRWLQSFNNPKCLLFFLSYYAMVLGFVVNGVNNVNTTSIERRFNLPSAKVGLISSAYDVSAAVLGVIVSFFASGKNKAKWIASAGVIMASGSVVMSLPHFTTGLYDLGEKTDNLCSSNETVCFDKEETYLSTYLYVFILGQMLHGVGGTTIYTVGVALIDDSVSEVSTPLYIAFLYGFSILGSGLGYLVGGKFLSYYVDFDTVDTSKLTVTPDDPRWVGAWWLPFIVSAVLNLAAAIPLFGYGAELPSARRVRETRISHAHNTGKHVVARTGIHSSARDAIRVLCSLARNPCFVFITLSMVTEGMILAGSATFLPKYIENGYGVSASWAAMLTGMAVVPSAAGGQFIGGLVARKMQLGIKGSIKLCLVGVTGVAVFSAALFMHCDSDVITGISAPYTQSQSDGPYSLTSSCNADCHCSTDSYEPVCDADSKIFFSPCHAGCRMELNNGHNFAMCSCIGNTNSTAGSSPMLTSIGCRKSCDLLYVFLGLLFILIWFSFFPIAPGDSIQLRCVPEQHKTFAQGVKLLVVRLLGTVPGPLFYGRMMDESCEVWRENCGDRLSCWILNRQALARNLFLLMMGTCVMTAIFCVLAMRLYKPPPEVVNIEERKRSCSEELT